MESNKDESLKCLKLSKDYLAKGDLEKALKFAKKSQNLYPSNGAESMYLSSAQRQYFIALVRHRLCRFLHFCHREYLSSKCRQRSRFNWAIYGG